MRLRSDEQLVALFRSGNEEAFRVIHDRYRARLYAYTRQMLGGSRSDAEDALQDVFLRAYSALRADDRPVVLKAWLYRVAHNRCIDQIRRPTPPAAEVFELSRAPLPDPIAEAERREDLRRLVADVQQLPEQQRSALLMRELEGLSYAELAEALDTTVPAVKSLLVRARIGLVEAQEARDAACAEIRNDLALSFGKGVRASARARRHMRECQGCREYRRGLRAVRSGLGALTPGGHPFGLVAKLLGLGGGAGGAAAGGSAAAGGGAAVVGGGVAGAGVVGGATAKVAAVVCCAAVVGGGAVEIKRHAPGDGGRDGGPAAAAKAHDRGRPAARAAVATPAGGRRAVSPIAAAPIAAGAADARARDRRGAREDAKTAPFVPDENAMSPHVAEEGDAAGSKAGGLVPPPTGGSTAPTEPAAPAVPAPSGATTTVPVAPPPGVKTGDAPSPTPRAEPAPSGGSTAPAAGAAGSGGTASAEVPATTAVGAAPASPAAGHAGATATASR